MVRIKTLLDKNGNAIGQADGVEVYRIYNGCVKTLQEKKDGIGICVNGMVFGAFHTVMVTSLEEAEMEFTKRAVVWMTRQLAFIHQAV